MANTEKVSIQIATVGTQQAAKDTKSLKQQIRDLKLELEQLTPETDEYNEKIRQMGELMHRQSELTEQAKLANDDLGQSYSNLSAMAQGMVGSFAAVQGILNSIGVSTSGAEESIKQMASLMSILQGLSSLDKAEKAFNGLNLKIDAFVKKLKLGTKQLASNTAAQKTNANAAKEDAASMGAATTATKAQGNAAATAAVKTNLLTVGFRNLGVAIKSFMASNPFTLILLGITAAITALSSFIEKQKESKREMEEMAKANADYMASRATDYSGTSLYTYEQIGRKRLQRTPPRYSLDPRTVDSKDVSGKSWQDKYDEDLDKYNSTLQKMEEADKKYTAAYKKQIDERKEYIVLQLGSMAKWYEDRIKENEKNAEKYGESLTQLYQQIGKAEQDYVDYEKDYYDNARKKLTEKEKERLANSAKAREETMNRELEDIKNIYEKEKLLNERSLKENEISQSEYYDNLLDIHERYSDAYDNWVKKYRKQKENELEIERNTDTELAIIRQQAEQRIKLYDEANNPKNTIAAQIAERQRNEAQRELELSRATNQAIADDVAATARKTNEIYNAWWLKKMVLIDQFSREEVEREREKNEQILQYQYDLKAEEQEILAGNRNADVDNETAQYLHDLEVEKQKLEANLILKEEYDKKVEELEREHQERLQAIDSQFDTDYQKIEDEKTEILRDIQENRYQMELEYFNRRMELEKAYIDAFSTIYGQITSLLGEVQNGYEEGTKQYEQIAETMLIMQTIESAMAGFKSGVEAPIPAPGNFVLGGILAALATATGIASISNLKNKKLSSAVGNASININPYETLSTQTNAELLGQIADSRCYVLEQDITSTVNRVSVTESEASF